MLRLRRRLAFVVAFLLLAFFLMLRPALGEAVTPGKAATDQLFLLVLILALIIGGVVEGLLIAAIIRFRRRKGFHLPSRVKTNDPILEFTWTALPVVVIVMVAGMTLYTLQITDTAPPGTITVDVIARQWSWEFVYPDGNRTEGVLYVQVNEVVLLEVTSMDVIHSYYIPEFGFKIDAVPGRVNNYWFKAEKVGEYHIQCAEYCGVGHYAMSATLVVFEEGSQPLPYGPPP
ncbi:MAG: cytochrome c oxidase subunit II [Thermoplasmata archaeon]